MAPAGRSTPARYAALRRLASWSTPLGPRRGAVRRGAYIYGTVVTSLIALLLAAPIGVGGALFIAEYAPRWLRDPVSFLVELLAAIPSIIYGLWGFFVLAPVMRGVVEPFLKNTIGSIPVVGALFSGPAVGRDILVAGVILAIMILPTIMAVSREILRAVPDTQREGMLALGATQLGDDQKRGAALRARRHRGAAILGLARALGETMAVTMVIGNSSTQIRASLFTPGLHDGQRHRQSVHRGRQGDLLQRDRRGRAGAAAGRRVHEHRRAAAGLERGARAAGLGDAGGLDAWPPRPSPLASPSAAIVPGTWQRRREFVERARHRADDLQRASPRWRILLIILGYVVIKGLPALNVASSPSARCPPARSAAASRRRSWARC